MSFVIANTDFVSQAAGNLARLGSTLSEANSAAAAQTIVNRFIASPRQGSDQATTFGAAPGQPCVVSTWSAASIAALQVETDPLRLELRVAVVAEGVDLDGRGLERGGTA